MQIEQFKEAVEQARRFIALSKAIKIVSLGTKQYIVVGTKSTGALKRCSLDLTRALAEMRKP
jgi:hypothetical protein